MTLTQQVLESHLEEIKKDKRYRNFFASYVKVFIFGKIFKDPLAHPTTRDLEEVRQMCLCLIEAIGLDGEGNLLYDYFVGVNERKVAKAIKVFENLSSDGIDKFFASAEASRIFNKYSCVVGEKGLLDIDAMFSDNLLYRATVVFDDEIENRLLTRWNFIALEIVKGLLKVTRY